MSTSPQTTSPPAEGEPGGLRSRVEHDAASIYQRCFESSPDTLQAKLDNFPKYVRLQALTRFLVRYELMRKVVGIKGSIVECGVFGGFGLMSWANLSSILEPTNFQRRIYGFDSFSGFPDVSEEDKAGRGIAQTGQLRNNSHDELEQIIKAYDANRYLGHMAKVELIDGDATKTIPRFIETHPHTLISLLFLDFDLYEPTLVALQNFLPRMPKGAIVAFDELDHPLWPGETLALLKAVDLPSVRLERFDFDPYVGFFVV
ncbi:MAG: hypothetical protein AMXMBFR33_65950 [Candidatus Xenobia bacterium]|jgi:hypothetical protein